MKPQGPPGIDTHARVLIPTEPAPRFWKWMQPESPYFTEKVDETGNRHAPLRYPDTAL
jgi:hypothetical protein